MTGDARAFTRGVRRTLNFMSVTQHDRVLHLSTPLPDDFLLLEAITGREAVSELFAFDLHLLHEEDREGLTPTVVDPRRLLGQTVAVRLIPPDGIERRVCGIVNRFVQLNRTPRFTHYRARLVPHVWPLTQRKQSRIFQQQSVPDILRLILRGFETVFEFGETYYPRDYCVQYKETDWDFAARLMEDEGIYYYFEHLADGKSRLVVADTAQSHRVCPVKHRVEFAAEVGQEYVVGAVSRWQSSFSWQSGQMTLRDHNFELPHKPLQTQARTRYEVGGNAGGLEVYEHSGGYAKRYTGITPGGGEQAGELSHIFEDGERTARVRMEELDVRYRVIAGESDCATFTAGHRFELLNHPLKVENAEYVLTGVELEAVQIPSYETGAETKRSFRNQFECIGYGKGATTFRPLRQTKKPEVSGVQTAVVVGQPGEEITTDKYGRVKVQFHWDREGGHNARSSCWIRVAQSWAGRNWGSVAIPRIGQEVVVEFIEGDIDRPLIVGNVYTPDQMPPYELPSNSHTMGFKSRTTKGGGGYNEIVIVDGKAGELVRVHAQKDMDTTVLNNDKQLVVVDREIEVNGKQHETIQGDKTTIVSKGNRITSVETGFQHNVVKEDVLIESTTSEVIIKAKTKITLEVGGNSITIDKDGNIKVSATASTDVAAPKNHIGGTTKMDGGDVFIN